ncbi:TIGR01459 family HAD-type hydrolase [Anianabacter salinae]|uniref:TIGR01459 family HAD-type hydrolase n=1 Tax=Anianabacter salinae TaxID=2851023 RepID=UPI00225DDFF7|nr:TIGR01459 family HAD-type hydrolase [Anianabacter salinae]MBV0911250.1 TIGR01459 family HAD-type hydrolase [Anianabacter salinae]
MTRIIDSLAEISDRYDALFCDLWGCLHNGVTAFPEAVAALQAFRAKGGAVVLLTNAPRPRASVARQIARMAVPEKCWDVIATSGDSARAAMFDGAVGNKVWFVGEPRDQSFFEPMQMVDDPADIEQVELRNAEGIVCAGPFDPMADPAVLRPELLFAKTKGLKLLCANPDIVVDRGYEREWCAGAIAALYTEMGGESLYFGKPHPPIYDLARRRLAGLGRDVDDSRILCVGDGILTDVKGAVGEDLDSVLITGGLAAAETRTGRDPEAGALAEYLVDQGFEPTYALGFLR